MMRLMHGTMHGVYDYELQCLAIISVVSIDV